MHEEVMEFISKFHKFDKGGVIDKTFTEGFCYYFALILSDRFGGEILYDQIQGHFMILIRDKLYDITGEVTSEYDISNLYDKSFWMTSQSIIRGCILKTRN